MGMHGRSIEAYSPTKNVTNLTYGEYWTRHQVPYERGREVTETLLNEAQWKPDDWVGMREPALDIINIHPGNSFSIYPGGAGFYSVWPTAQDSFRFRARSVRAPKELRRFDVESGEQYDSERVLDEDGVAMPMVLQGARSSKAQAGPMAGMEEAATIQGATQALNGFVRMKTQTNGLKVLLVFASGQQEFISAAVGVESGTQHTPGSLLLVATHSLPALINCPSLKQETWAALQMLIADLEAGA